MLAGASRLTSLLLAKWIVSLLLVSAVLYALKTFWLPGLHITLAWRDSDVPQADDFGDALERTLTIVSTTDDPSMVSCEWAEAVPLDDHGITPRKRPRFSLTSAWLKPESARYGPAPEKIPETLLEEYTMGNNTAMGALYSNEAFLGNNALVSNWTADLLKRYRQAVQTRERWIAHYGLADVYASLEVYGNQTVRNKRGLVIGSASPWLEAVLLEFGGASHITTLEFGTIFCEDKQITTYTPKNFTMDFLEGRIEPYDFAYTFSSLEHDGLGRYGDVLNPSGDLDSMARLLHVVKPGGYLFFSAPCCNDAIQWNAHRIYGKRRLTELFAGWRIVATFPEKAMQKKTGLWDWTYHPVFMVQNTFGCAQGEKTNNVAGLFKSLRL